MARPPKGKALTLRPIRLDDDVWAECQRLGKEHGTINEGLRTVLIVVGDLANPTHKIAEQVGIHNDEPIWGEIVQSVERSRRFKGPILKPKDRK